MKNIIIVGAVVALIVAGGAFERGFVDWLGLGTMAVLAIPAWIAIRKAV